MMPWQIMLRHINGEMMWVDLEICTCYDVSVIHRLHYSQLLPHSLDVGSAVQQLDGRQLSAQ